jgi:hypothetical protein
LFVLIRSFLFCTIRWLEWQTPMSSSIQIALNLWETSGFARCVRERIELRR